MDTLAPMWRDLMDAPTIRADHCIVCGATFPLNQHHIVPRSAGKLYSPSGREIVKPTITLCGYGNASGCHGKAHAGRLHFRYKGRLQYLETEPCDRLTALEKEGWRNAY